VTATATFGRRNAGQARKALDHRVDAVILLDRHGFGADRAENRGAATAVPIAKAEGESEPSEEPQPPVRGAVRDEERA
jgi:hypothetical protein